MKTIRKILKSVLELWQSSAIVTNIKLRRVISDVTNSLTVIRTVIKEQKELFLDIDFLILSFSDNLLL